MTFEYTTKFSERRKTLGLSVERDKSIVVYAPKGTTNAQIESFVQKKKFWLYQKIHFSPKFGKPQETTPFVSGKNIMYLGTNYQLDVIPEPIEGIQFSSKFLISKSNIENAPQLLEEWYIRKAKENFTYQAKQYAQTLGVSYNRLNIKDLKYSWGTCSPKNNLSLNWKLIKAPQFVINYVIIHELAHLLELNHSPDFWNIVKIQMPNYLEAKEWLKLNGERIL